MSKRKDRWAMSERVGVWMSEMMDRWVQWIGLDMDGRTDEWMDEQIGERLMYERMNG